MIDLPTPALIGVIHLAPLPGSPQHLLPVPECIDRALKDACALASAGFHAVIIENYGDAPFPADRVASSSLAAMAVIADQVRQEINMPIGINVLRNDALAALGIASATGASFVRVNIHTGVYATDQGMIEGRADATLRFRRQLGVKVAILADVHVKHATPISQPDLAQAAKNTAYRGLADGLIITGAATGEQVDFEHLRLVREAVPDRRLFVGSGATPQSVASLLTVATGVIVGSALKARNDPSNPIDPRRAADFVHAASGVCPS